MRALRPLLHEQADVLRNDTQHRTLERALHVINRLHTRIEVLDEEGQTNAHHQANDDAQGDVKRFVRPHGPHAGHRFVHDLHHHGLGEFDVDLFGRDLHVEDLAEALQFIERALGFKVGPRIVRLLHVGGGGLVHFLFQVFQTIAQREHPRIQAEHDAIDAALDLAMQVVRHGLALNNLGVLWTVVLLQRHQSLFRHG